MQRICFLLQVRKDQISEYKKAHENVWPEMREALSRTGWHNYSLFLREDGLLVGYVETPDFEAAINGMQREAINEKWQLAMKPFFEALPGGAADKSMQPLEPVFYLA